MLGVIPKKDAKETVATFLDHHHSSPTPPTSQDRVDSILTAKQHGYYSNFSNEINDKLYEVNKLILQNKNIDKSFFNSLHQNIDKLLNSIIYSFNDDKSLILKPYTKNESDMFYQINKYNEINDIIKTLEVMN